MLVLFYRLGKIQRLKPSARFPDRGKLGKALSIPHWVFLVLLLPLLQMEVVICLSWTLTIEVCLIPTCGRSASKKLYSFPIPLMIWQNCFQILLSEKIFSKEEPFKVVHSYLDETGKDGTLNLSVLLLRIQTYGKILKFNKSVQFTNK